MKPNHRHGPFGRSEQDPTPWRLSRGRRAGHFRYSFPYVLAGVRVGMKDGKYLANATTRRAVNPS